MPLRIACDLDGTLADMESALQREVERLFGAQVDLRARARIMRIEEETAGVKRPLTGAELRRLWTHVRTIENFWTTLDESEPGSVERLATLARRYDWEVIFLTRRPFTAGETAQAQTQRWLKARGFELPSVFVLNGSRGKVADAFALDVVIDDRAENAVDVALVSKARSILVWRDHPVPVPADVSTLVDVVYSVAEAMDLLEQMSAPSTRARRLMRRMRAALPI